MLNVLTTCHKYHGFLVHACHKHVQVIKIQLIHLVWLGSIEDGDHIHFSKLIENRNCKNFKEIFQITLRLIPKILTKFFKLFDFIE